MLSYTYCARTGFLLAVFVSSLTGANNYLVHNLVSDLPGIADHQDKNLVNAWGNGFSGTSPFWIGNNGTGTSTLYDGTGTPNALVVSIPGPPGSNSSGAVTGVLFNGNATSFNVAAGKAASFIFCTEDGTISGWNSSVDGTHALIMIDNSKSGAVYKGCALGGTTAAPLLYAANFNSGKIDVWDGNLNPVKTAAFSNPAVPSNFAPFNIENLGGRLYVAYAMPDADKHDDVAGAGNGYVAVFDLAGNLLGNLTSKGPLNSPWGMAMAPASFGDFANTLLVSNFGDGKINAFNSTTGAQMGTLNDVNGRPISIPGLWSINFGNSGRGGDTATLYFTAGISGAGDPVESHGLLGSVQPAPFMQSSGILNGASLSATVAPNAWVTIKGGALAATTRSWQSSDFTGNKLPTQLDGVGVMVNGEATPVYFISPAQINFLMPADMVAGPVQIQTTNNGLTSATVTTTLASVAPAFFTLGTADAQGNLNIAAEHADGSVGGPANLIAGLTTTPFKTGETIVLFATGLGTTNPGVPNGLAISAPLPLLVTPTVMMGGVSAQVTFAGLVGPGLYQVNATIPSGIKPGTGATTSVPVVLQMGAAQSQNGAVIAVVNSGQ